MSKDFRAASSSIAAAQSPVRAPRAFAGDGPPTLARSYGWRKAANHGLDLANTKACLQRQAYKEQVIKHAGVVNAPAALSRRFGKKTLAFVVANGRSAHAGTTGDLT